MRPNIDLSWELHGRVKEYSEETDRTIEEAYKHLLKSGLDSVSRTSGGLHLEQPDDPYFTQISGNGVGDVFLFSNFAPYPGDKVAIRIKKPGGVSFEKAENILSHLSKHFSIHNGSYSIQETNSGWYDSGSLGDFFYWCTNRDELYQKKPEGHEIEFHHSASAAFIGKIDYPGRHVVVYGRPSSEGFDKFGVVFMLNGYPVDPSPFVDFADDTGLQMGLAETWDKKSGTADSLIREDIEPDQLLMENKGTVGGILTENPFFENEELVEEVFGKEIRQFSSLKRIKGDLKHFVDESDDYNLFTSRFNVNDLSEVVYSPFDLYSVDFEVNW